MEIVPALLLAYRFDGNAAARRAGGTHVPAGAPWRWWC